MNGPSPRQSTPATPRADRAEIARGVALICGPGGPHEVRVPHSFHDGVISGYFADPRKLEESLAELSGRGPGVYFTLNPVDPALLARAADRVKTRVRATTTDGQIVCRRWLLIDIDARRPAGVSSTEAEHEAALTAARKIRQALRERGWSDPILADSGNGGHLLFAVDLPNDEPSRKRLEYVLKALALMFDDDVIEIDQKVFNASRISKAYGTAAAKGDSTIERPHRLARIMEAPDKLVPVATELLESVAALAEELQPPRPASSPRAGGVFNFEEFIGRYIEAGDPVSYHGGRRWRVTCPWNSDHENAAVFESSNGALGFHCFHRSCADKHWQQLREYFEGPRPNGSTGPFPGAEEPPPREEEPQTDSWPTPQLVDALPAVLPFDLDLLPEFLVGPTEHLARMLQLPPEMPAVALIAALTGATNRRALIQPSRFNPGWIEVLNLWAMIIAAPGVGKSPLLRLCLGPLLDLEKEHRQEHEVAMRKYAREQEEYKIRQQMWEQQYKAAVKASNPTPPPEDPPVAPALKRLVVNDSTYEKTHVTMSQNPQGLLLACDEASGLLTRLERPEYAGERAFMLSCWSGTTSHTIERISRGNIFVEHACLSFFGFLTPDKLQSYLAQTRFDRPTVDGLFQRFQLSIWPDIPKDWTFPRQTPNALALDDFRTVCAALTRLDHEKPKVFQFTSEAQELFAEWQEALMREVRGGTLTYTMQSHLAKYPKLVAALAALFELSAALARGKDVGLVSLEQTARALDWCPLLRSHVERIYSAEVSPAVRAAALLAQKIRKHEADEDGILHVRTVYRHCWEGLTETEMVRAACNVLADAKWLREIGKPTGGRPDNRYWINPKIWL